MTGLECEVVMLSKGRHRDVVMMTHESDRRLNMNRLASLEQADRARFFHRFAMWKDGANQPETSFHGFPNSRDYKVCFSFRSNDYRAYGYLCNPSIAVPRKRVCVLVTLAEKHQEKVDTAILDRILALMLDEGGLDKVRSYYENQQ